LLLCRYTCRVFVNYFWISTLIMERLGIYLCPWPDPTLFAHLDVTPQPRIIALNEILELLPIEISPLFIEGK
jgi:hypothetical protein